MEHRILREGGARDEGAAHRDGEGRAGLEGVEAGILLGGGAGARGLRCPSGAAGGNTRPAAAGTLVPPPGGGVGGPLGAGALSQGLHGRPAGQGGLPPLPAVGGIPHRRRDPPHPGSHSVSGSPFAILSSNAIWKRTIATPSFTWAFLMFSISTSFLTPFNN